ncbi:MAG: fructose-bisphosphatase class II [Azospirillum sp.]|nr:fructose-bisphosphatase class II [Azospirillum sp.]
MTVIDAAPHTAQLTRLALAATEAAALAASRWIGRHSENAADHAAVEGMAAALARLPFAAAIDLGEGQEGVAAKLHHGQTLGVGGPPLSLALNALEGASTTARGGFNALSILAMSDDGGFLTVPDVYMEKIAIGPGLPYGVVDLDLSAEVNVRNLARAKNVDPGDLMVCILDRARNDDLFYGAIHAGARTIALADGDTSGIIGCVLADSGIDMYIGSGGAREGVLAAAAIACLGGQFQGRMRFRSEDELAQAAAWGITEPGRKYTVADLAWGDLVLAATGVTSGVILPGVRQAGKQATTHSIVMDSRSGTFQRVTQEHQL